MSHKTLCGAIQSKFWGQTQCIFVGPLSETHFLTIKRGGYCSKHRHRQKWNRFFLISGKLEVKIFREDGEDTTVLHPGQFTDVPPDVYHQFKCLEDCHCLEIYWVNELDTRDIERESVGGLENLPAAPCFPEVVLSPFISTPECVDAPQLWDFNVMGT